MLRFLLVCALLIACCNGCAATAKRPSSPAASLSARMLLLNGAPANQRYYILVFGSQSAPPRPRFSHCWATVVKVTNSAAGPQIEQQTISWYPRDLDINLFRLRVEPGVNLGLNFTIEEVLRQHERISLWGPYELWHGGYQRFDT